MSENGGSSSASSDATTYYVKCTSVTPAKPSPTTSNGVLKLRLNRYDFAEVVFEPTRVKDEPTGSMAAERGEPETLTFRLMDVYAPCNKGKDKVTGDKFLRINLQSSFSGPAWHHDINFGADGTGQRDRVHALVTSYFPRSSLLRRDPNVLNEFKELVVDLKIEAEESFWNARKQKLEEEAQLLRQKKGLTELVDPATHQPAAAGVQGSTTTSGSAATVAKEITKDMMSRIFLENPAVLSKYEQTVPHVMSELEFWGLYMHSKYVLGSKRPAEVTRNMTKAKRAALPSQAMEKREADARDRSQARAAELFGGDVTSFQIETNEEYRAKQADALRLSRVDPAIDLVATENDNQALEVSLKGYGAQVRDPTIAIDASVASEMVRQLRKEGVQPIDLGAVRRAAAQGEPVLSLYNRRSEIALEEPSLLSVSGDVDLARARAKAARGKQSSQVNASESADAKSESLRLRQERMVENLRSTYYLDGDLNERAETEAGVPLHVTMSRSGAVESDNAKSAGAAASTTKVDRTLPVNAASAFNPTQALQGLGAPRPATSGKSPQPQHQTVPREVAEFRRLPADLIRRVRIEIHATRELANHFHALQGRAQRSESARVKLAAIVEKIRERLRRVNEVLRGEMRGIGAMSGTATSLLNMPVGVLAKCLADYDAAQQQRQRPRAREEDEGQSGVKRVRLTAP